MLDKINSIYSFIFERLDLTPQHRDGLLERGLSLAEIKSLGYRSWPLKRSYIINQVVEKFGDDLEGIPGFFFEKKWKLSGAVGLAIPVLNKDGLLVAVKIRPDNPVNPANKYTHLSSNPKPDDKGDQKYPKGASAKISVHWPIRIKSNSKIEKIRITEGELKADIATNLSSIYTISMPGVGLWREAVKALDLLEDKPIVYLAYDSDKDREHHPEYGVGQGVSGTYAVAKSLIELHTELEMNGYKVVIEDWDGEIGKGIDDVLACGAESKIKFLNNEEVTQFIRTHSPKLPTPSEGWLYIIATKRFVNLGNRRQYDKEQYQDLFCHLTNKKNPVDLALRSREFQKVDLPTYHPRMPNTFELDGLTYYNGWKENGLEERRGDVSRFMSHLEYILPEESEREIMLDFMAYNIQNEGEKVHWALLLQGTQGTGKSYFGYVMRLLLGAHNVSNPSNEAIHENYTQWQAECSLVVIEEMMARGRLELMNKLKPMITQDIATIREMYKPAYEQPNRFNMMMFTNHEDAIIIDESDRRYCVLFSPAKPRTLKNYYKDLWAWTDEHAGELLYWFKRRELKSFNPKGHAPMTAGKQVLIRESKMPLEAWITESIENEVWPFMSDLVTTKDLAACVPSYIRGVTPQLIGRVLKKCGAIQLQQVQLSSGRARVWAVRRQDTWSCAGTKTIKEEYEKWGEQAEPGGNPLAESKPM